MVTGRISERETLSRATSVARQVKRILAASIIIGLLSPIVALADFVGIDPGQTLGYLGGTYDGYLTWSSSDTEITATDGWANTSTEFTWTVSRPLDDGPLTYTYRFICDGQPDLSHFDLQVSAGVEGLAAFDVTKSKDFLNINAYDPVEQIGSGQLPSWWVAGETEGIKFEGWGTEDTDATTMGWDKIEFQSYRLPMWGMWEAKGGKLSTAYNSSSGETLVPDTAYVPVPGAVLLGSLGLSVAGHFLRRRKDLA